MSSNSIIFRSQDAIMFSQLTEKQLGLKLTWKSWIPRIIELSSTGVLTAIKKDRAGDVCQFDLSTIIVTHMNHNAEDVESTSPMQKETGVLMQVRDLDGHETQIRMILKESVRTDLYKAIRTCSRQHNLDNVRMMSITQHVLSSQEKMKNSKRSAMRSAVATAMDSFGSEQRKQHIKDKRGAFKWLPVWFANDLVHGSWWFVLGSIAFVISSAVVLKNSFDEDLGSDDSILSRFRYRSSWVLMIICGVFCTLGSMAFVRAVHEDPPMKPLFSWYHLQSDELLGSWLFFCATIPVIPYCLIYIAASHEQPIYILALAVTIVFIFATYLFVRAYYPSDEERKQLIAPIATFFCKCCCSKDWLKKHFYNDWLAGTWLIYWGTLFACFVCGILFFVALSDENTLQSFIMGTAFFENICFLIGSAYFVAGSYPEDDGSDENSAFASSKSYGSTSKTRGDLTAPLVEGSVGNYL